MLALYNKSRTIQTLVWNWRILHKPLIFNIVSKYCGNFKYFGTNCAHFPFRNFSWRYGIMYIWVILSLVMVLAVKFYTARELANLERRLLAVKEALFAKRNQYQLTQDKQAEVKTQELNMVERLVHMKEIIQDINIRLTQTDRASIGEDDEIVSKILQKR